MKKFSFAPHQPVSGVAMFHEAVVSLTQCGFPSDESRDEAQLL